MFKFSTNTIEKISIRWGLITVLLLSAYFLLMKILGLIHIPELRLLNASIMFFGVFQAIKMSKANLPRFNYLQGIGTGALTGLIASTTFAVLGVIFLTFVDPNFLMDVNTNEPLGIYMDKYNVSVQLFIEGSASGFLCSYASMQWLRTPHLQGG